MDENEYEHGHEGRGGCGNGRRNGDKNREGGGGEREPGDIKGGLEDIREKAVPIRNPQLQPQDPTTNEIVASCAGS